MKNKALEIFKALAHPTRKSIVENLREKGALSHNELLECIGVSNHGKFGFHLRALKGLVEHDLLTNKYRLTADGKLAGRLIENVKLGRLGDERILDEKVSTFVRNLESGDHAVLLFRDADFQHEMALFFLEAGLMKGESAVYLVPENKFESASRQAKRLGLTTNYGEAFTVMSAEEWYLKRGKARAETIIANWIELSNNRLKAKFAGLRAAGDMDVFFDHGEERELLRYETMIGKRLVSGLCGLCLYDVAKIGGSQIIQVTKAHSHLISKDMMWKIP